jgi:hypothetical protein
MKTCCTLILLLTFFFGKAQGQWSQSNDNYTMGRLGIGLSTPASDFDIDIFRTNPNTGIKMFNSNWAGRSIVLFGQGLGGKYGFVAHHGQSYVASAGYTQTYKTSSTVLEGSDINGLGIISASDIRFSSGGEDDTKQRMIINAAGNVGIGTTTPISKLSVIIPVSTSTVGADPNAYGAYFTDNTSATLAIRSLGNGAMHLTTDGPGRKLILGGGGFEQTIFLTGGNAGIGTASPGVKLDIIGAGGTNTDLRVNGRIQTGDALNFGGMWVSSTGLFMGQMNASALGLYNNGWRLIADANGNVGIGTVSPDQKLTVKGTIHAQEVKVDMSVPGPDYVFEKDYDLLSLAELENYIQQNKHLPEVPSAKEMEKEGLNLKEMNLILLKKMEEMTLHMIEMKKEINELKSAGRRK